MATVLGPIQRLPACDGSTIKVQIIGKVGRRMQNIDVNYKSSRTSMLCGKSENSHTTKL